MMEERVRGKRVLIAMAAAGHAVQEVARTAGHLEDAGCAVVFATLDGVEPRFDPLCNALAAVERLGDPMLPRFAAERRRGRLRDLPALRRLADTGGLEAWLDGFDAVVVAGGHGAVFDRFVRDPLTVDLIARFYRRDRVVGLICHAPMIAAQPSRLGPAVIAGRRVTCWPRAIERVCGALPLVGAYLMPHGRPVAVLLEAAGAEVDDALLPGWVKVATDGRLVTARGPWSTPAFARAVVHALATAT